MNVSNIYRNLLLVFIFLSSAALSGFGEESPVPSSPANIHVVIEGDTLWHISGIYLKQPTRWPEIWDLNKEAIENPHRIYPDQKIFVSKSGETEQPAESQTEKQITEPPASASEPAAQEPPIAENKDSFSVSPVQEENEPYGRIDVLPEKKDHPVLIEIGKIASRKKKTSSSGHVTKSLDEKELMETGDELSIFFKKFSKIPDPGTILIVYRQREYLLDAEGNLLSEFDPTYIVETVGAIEVTQKINDRKALARVIAISSPIEPGDSVKIWQTTAQ